MFALLIATVILTIVALACLGHVVTSCMLGFDWLGRERRIRDHDHLLPRNPSRFRPAR